MTRGMCGINPRSVQRNVHCGFSEAVDLKFKVQRSKKREAFLMAEFTPWMSRGLTFGADRKKSVKFSVQNSKKFRFRVALRVL